MKWFEWYWTFLVGGFVVLFLAVEIPSIVSGHPERTLSYWVWRRLESWTPGSNAPWTLNHWIFGIIFLILFLWLAVHFAFGWIR